MALHRLFSGSAQAVQWHCMAAQGWTEDLCPAARARLVPGNTAGPEPVQSHEGATQAAFAVDILIKLDDFAAQLPKFE